MLVRKFLFLSPVSYDNKLRVHTFNFQLHVNAPVLSWPQSNHLCPHGWRQILLWTLQYNQAFTFISLVPELATLI